MIYEEHLPQGKIVHLVIYHQTDSCQLSAFTEHAFDSIKFIESDQEQIEGPCALISGDCLKEYGLPPFFGESKQLTCFIDYALNDQEGKQEFIHFSESDPNAEYGDIAFNGFGPLDHQHADGLAPTGLYYIPAGRSIRLDQLKSLPIERLELHPRMPRHQKPRPALFLDRDGVINEDTEYLIDPKDLRLKEGIIELIQLANRVQWPVICLTNQSGVARAKFSLDQVEQLHRAIDLQLSLYQAKINHFEISPFHYAKGVGQYKKHSVLRKPYPGMLLKACRHFDLDLEKSVMVGDKESDLLHFSPANTFLLAGAYPLSGTRGTVINNFREVLSFIRNSHK